MALINIESVPKEVLSRIRKLAVNEGVEILSYKRNRGATLLRMTEETVLVRERGYRDRELTVGLSSLARILKSIVAVEFPRSRKVRVYRIDGQDAAAPARKRL